MYEHARDVLTSHGYTAARRCRFAVIASDKKFIENRLLLAKMASGDEQLYLVGGGGARLLACVCLCDVIQGIKYFRVKRARVPQGSSFMYAAAAAVVSSL